MTVSRVCGLPEGRVSPAIAVNAGTHLQVNVGHSFPGLARGCMSDTPAWCPRLPGRKVLDVATGRVLAQMALREPMRAIGWDPRAAGWFTSQIAAGFLGVAALGVASKYSRPGAARVMLHVGIRDEATEQTVSRLCGLKDGGYRQRTTTTGIGYLLPGSSWREWEVAAGSADEVACCLASLVRQYAQPYLRRLSSHRGELLEAARRSPGYSQAAGACRVAVLIARHQGPGEAIDFLRERMDGLGTRTDVAAREEREMAARTRSWLALPDPAA